MNITHFEHHTTALDPFSSYAKLNILNIPIIYHNASIVDNKKC